MKMGTFSLVRKIPMVYKTCAPDVSCVQQRTELNSTNSTYRELISIGYKEGYSH